MRAFVKSIFVQVHFFLKKWTTILVFAALLLLVIYNYFFCINKFRDYDVVTLLHPMRMIIIGYDISTMNGVSYLALTMLFPLMVSLPAGLSYANDKDLGAYQNIAGRIGIPATQWSRLVAVYFTNMIVFSLPVLISIILNCLAFPISASGNMFSLGKYSPELTLIIKNYLFSELYIKSPYAYAILGALAFGSFAGLLGAFTYAITTVIRFKYKVFYIIPVFILLSVSARADNSLDLTTRQYAWMKYVFLFEPEPKNISFVIITVVIIAMITLAATAFSSRKDSL